jgi:GDPmannose 4,6-dehydratase
MREMATALITGITGQDGSYLAELLLSKGYKVAGLVRQAEESLEHIAHITDRLTLLDGDLRDQRALRRAVETTQPDEVYNLASQSSVARSWEDPVTTAEVTGLAVSRLLEEVRAVKARAKFFQASSCEIFGDAAPAPQNESTPIRPGNPYAIAKAYAHFTTTVYREHHRMFAACGIFFNHESPRRGSEFVTRKITQGVAAISHGLQKELELGNLDVKRDWGFAGDYVEAAWRMLQQPEPEDFVIGTGEAHTVAEFAREAFACVDLDWQKFVRVDPQLKRTTDIGLLLADPSKARAKLGWQPRISFSELVRRMVEADLALPTESIR